MRGNCSPLDISRTPLDADSALEENLARSQISNPTDGASLSRDRKGAHDFERLRHFAFGDENRKSAFASDLQRIQAQNLAGTANVLPHRDEVLLDLHGEVRALGNLIENTGQPPRVISRRQCT